MAPNRTHFGGGVLAIIAYLAAGPCPALAGPGMDTGEPHHHDTPAPPPQSQGGGCSSCGGSHDGPHISPGGARQKAQDAAAGGMGDTGNITVSSGGRRGEDRTGSIVTLGATPAGTGGEGGGETGIASLSHPPGATDADDDRAALAASKASNDDLERRLQAARDAQAAALGNNNNSFFDPRTFIMAALNGKPGSPATRANSQGGQASSVAANFLNNLTDEAAGTAEFRRNKLNQLTASMNAAQNRTDEEERKNSSQQPATPPPEPPSAVPATKSSQSPAAPKSDDDFDQFRGIMSKRQ